MSGARKAASETAGLVRSARVSAALETALGRAREVAGISAREAQELLAPELAALADRLERESNMPGPNPNLELARAVGTVLGGARGAGAAIAEALLAMTHPFLRFVAAFALAELWLASFDRKRALGALHDLAGDEKREARRAAVLALRELVARQPERGVDALAALTDGYLHASVALEAIAERDTLTKIARSEGVLARLDEAFELADASHRAAERLQGVRTLRDELPERVARLADRFPETLDWLEQQTSRKRPETREVVAACFKALRKSGHRGAVIDRLAAALEATAPEPRDPTRIVKGTRKRSRGR